ncbi:MAG: hypothetical protein A3C79_01800 [Candidatus Taylorbacteria bacterium RIFCSPHIGHO2_02_FULL_45_28]|nr:MAG: hypothetical protein A2830_02600 [Candidatus Taylorbacteria bacterium RIFCSPHIGHO2_01_FULL_44_110]OHA25184.1 MAG: hypothetical protein A3C79_01800 [Candidatus Taylorbacteria bacterium RIFCSPHIGHO2_02_FULL_45_28]OHA43385.1 MAG: hypothetical protein A3G04_02735 [Candidatus Taylorbacteria bacterium RIFCSPLOWO2_12_FULL_44_9]
MITHFPKTHAPGLFFREGIKKFIKNGSLVPSSKYLGKMMLKSVEMKQGVFIVELGAGTGTFTKMILSEMPKSGRLVVFEINPILAEYLRWQIVDPRIMIIEADAVDMVSHLSNLNTNKPNYIISGILIGNMRPSLRKSLLSAVHETLAEDGLFIQFQYFLASLVAIRKFFHTKIIGYEYRNIPPAFVYSCSKKIL